MAASYFGTATARRVSAKREKKRTGGEEEKKVSASSRKTNLIFVSAEPFCRFHRNWRTRANQATGVAGAHKLRRPGRQLAGFET